MRPIQWIFWSLRSGDGYFWCHNLLIFLKIFSISMKVNSFYYMKEEEE